jgi:hypothetical protein
VHSSVVPNGWGGFPARLDWPLQMAITVGID